MSRDTLISGKRWSRIPLTRRSSVTTLFGSRFFGFSEATDEPAQYYRAPTAKTDALTTEEGVSGFLWCHEQPFHNPILVGPDDVASRIAALKAKPVGQKASGHRRSLHRCGCCHIRPGRRGEWSPR